MRLFDPDNRSDRYRLMRDNEQDPAMLANRTWLEGLHLPRTDAVLGRAPEPKRRAEQTRGEHEYRCD